jgi:hypothetical protein
MAGRTILLDRGWSKLRRNALGLNGRAVKVGLLANSGSRDGVSIVDYAAFNEFGTETIPARPFMRKAADDNEAAAIAYARRLSGLLMAGRLSPDGVLDAMGLWFQARIRTTIRTAFRWAVPNAPSTIRRKGSTRPLIDTGAMHGAVNYEKGRLG